MKFAANGTLYRGCKPVMWSVVEKTALAEAEVEYEDFICDTVWVKFPVAPFSCRAKRPKRIAELASGASVVIWTTTPWTIPGNRAISYSTEIAYGLYEVVDAPSDNWAKPGDRFVLADKLAIRRHSPRRVSPRSQGSGAVSARRLAGCLVCEHPLKPLRQRLRL